MEPRAPSGCQQACCPLPPLDALASDPVTEGHGQGGDAQWQISTSAASSGGAAARRRRCSNAARVTRSRAPPSTCSARTRASSKLATRAAIADRLTFGANIIETGTVTYQLAHTRARPGSAV
jgi:hypothetical protein